MNLFHFGITIVLFGAVLFICLYLAMHPTNERPLLSARVAKGLHAALCIAITIGAIAMCIGSLLANAL